MFIVPHSLLLPFVPTIRRVEGLMDGWMDGWMDGLASNDDDDDDDDDNGSIRWSCMRERRCEGYEI